MRAVRLSLLGVLANLLTRCLTYVTARLEPAEAPPIDPRQPPPPDHWVELVRQHAPQLLDADAPVESGVIGWRADDAPPPLTAPIPMRQRPPARAKRPLRLVQVSAQSLDEAPHPPTPSLQSQERGLLTQVGRGGATPLEVQSEMPSAPVPNYVPPDDAPVVIPLLRRSVDAVAPPVREVAAQPDAVERVSPRYADMPFEQTRIRETSTSVPGSAAVPIIRTSAGSFVQPEQRRTGVPNAPTQVVLRPTSTPLPLSSESIPAERWAALPELPADEPRDAAFERQRRERLKREQEGRAWSE